MICFCWDGGRAAIATLAANIKRAQQNTTVTHNFAENEPNAIENKLVDVMNVGHFIGRTRANSGVRLQHCSGLAFGGVKVPQSAPETTE